MGTYREQLLKETYGNSRAGIYGESKEEPSGSFSLFKLKFTVCLLLFAGFVYLNFTGQSFLNVTAEQIREAVITDSVMKTDIPVEY